MPALVFQAHYQDHLTPLLAAFNDAMAWGGEAAPIPMDPVFIERIAFPGGGRIRLMPSSALLAWMSEVMANHEAVCRDRESRQAAALRMEEMSA